ncbi:MAG: SWIM zinc finger family protein [Dinghuibacter sp.]|nr:SWIM zinc finger family protein [Dinghuibacter sp.]
MEKISVADFLKKINSRLLASAAKLPVRELEEESEGKYVCFVDDGEESYDVQLVLNKKGVFESMVCDCKKKAPCLHIIAAANALKQPAQKKKEKTTAKPAKIPEALRKLEEVAPEELRLWVKGLLEKNKDLQLAFTYHFSKKELYTPEELIAQTKLAVHSVVKNKKNIDQTLLKKILDLWADIHQPVLEKYIQNVTDAEYFKLLKTIVQQSTHYRYYFNINTNKFDRHAEKYLNGTVNTINNLQNEEAWKNVVQMFYNCFTDEKNQFCPIYVRHLFNILDVSAPARKVFIFDLLARFSVKHKGNPFFWYKDYIKGFFIQATEHGYFEQYYQEFVPYFGEDEYNIPLIKKLIETGKTAHAEKLCNEIIALNTREGYNVPYWLLLRNIYEQENDHAGLLAVAGHLVKYTFNFDDFLLVDGAIINEEQRKKNRTKIFTSARNGRSPFLNERKLFCFQLLAHEVKYNKMFDLVEHFSTYEIVLMYFKQLFNHDRARLLAALINKRSDHDMYFFGSYDEKIANREREGEMVKQLAEQLVNHYDKKILDGAFGSKINERYYFNKSELVEYYVKHYMKNKQDR